MKTNFFLSVATILLCQLAIQTMAQNTIGSTSGVTYQNLGTDTYSVAANGASTGVVTVKSNGSKTVGAKLDFNGTLNSGSATLAAFGGQRQLGAITLNAQNGVSALNFDFSGFGTTRARIEYYRQGIKVHEYLDNKANGPSAGSKVKLQNVNELVMVKDNVKLTDQEEWWPTVFAIIACCVQAEYTYNSDGSWSATVGFDCDCLGMVIAPDNQQQYHIDSIKIIPEDLVFNPFGAGTFELKTMTTGIQNYKLSLNQ